jgi:hypothetical protein
MGTPPDFELNRNGTGTPSNRRYCYACEEYSLTSSYVNRILTQAGQERFQLFQTFNRCAQFKPSWD